MAESILTNAESKKLGQVVSRVQGLPKDEKGKLNTYRFSDKYLRFKLGRRGTGPHSHGLNEIQRKNLKDAINKAFNIKVKAHAAKATPAKAQATKRQTRKANPAAAARATQRSVPAPGTGPKSTSELAGAQQARAAQGS